jgi:hypothetical protein
MTGAISGNLTRTGTRGALTVTAAGGTGIRTLSLGLTVNLTFNTQYYMGFLKTGAGDAILRSDVGPGSSTGVSCLGATLASVIPATESTRTAASRLIYMELN